MLLSPGERQPHVLPAQQPLTDELRAQPMSRAESPPLIEDDDDEEEENNKEGHRRRWRWRKNNTRRNEEDFNEPFLFIKGTHTSANSILFFSLKTRCTQTPKIVFNSLKWRSFFFAYHWSVPAARLKIAAAAWAVNAVEATVKDDDDDDELGDADIDDDTFFWCFRHATIACTAPAWVETRSHATKGHNSPECKTSASL